MSENMLPASWVVKCDVDHPNWNCVTEYINNKYNVSLQGNKSVYYGEYTKDEGDELFVGDDESLRLPLSVVSKFVHLTVDDFLILTGKPRVCSGNLQEKLDDAQKVISNQENVIQKIKATIKEKERYLFELERFNKEIQLRHKSQLMAIYYSLQSIINAGTHREKHAIISGQMRVLESLINKGDSLPLPDGFIGIKQEHDYPF